MDDEEEFYEEGEDDSYEPQPMEEAFTIALEQIRIHLFNTESILKKECPPLEVVNVMQPILLSDKLILAIIFITDRLINININLGYTSRESKKFLGMQTEFLYDLVEDYGIYNKFVKKYRSILKSFKDLDLSDLNDYKKITEALEFMSKTANMYYDEFGFAEIVNSFSEVEDDGTGE